MENRFFRASLLSLALSSALYAGPLHAVERSVSYTYNALGLVETVNGPRTDVADITTYGYDNQGRLTTVTNALNQVTTLGNFDLLGNPQTVTDANGVVSSLTYTPQGWLSTVTRGGFTTTYVYNAVGDITQLTQGDGSFLTYTWDDARRLKAVTNNLGDKVEYDLDLMGNRTAQRLKDSGGVLTQQHQWVYDELGRLLRSVGAAGQNARQQYDLNDNPTVSTNPNNNSHNQAYDALNRLVQNTDPLNGVTGYEYDAQDNLTKVQDPRGVTTQYQYDGLGNLTQQISPDSGTSTFEYDAAGNVTKKTDARGVVTTYTYDALNRITAKRYPANSALDITYAYDMTAEGNKGIGHLTALLDSSGLIGFMYDERGNLISQTRTVKVSNVDRFENLAYSYDGASRLSGIGYPGFTVTYPRNTAGQVTGVSLQIGSQPATTLASNISYLPYGPLKTLTWGNGIQLTRQYDQDYQLTQQNVGSWQTAYSFDANGNIKSRDHSLFGALNYGYDALDRLTEVKATGTRTAYLYDATGNRKNRMRYTTNTSGVESLTAVQPLTIAADSNRITSDTMDAAGNVLKQAALSKTFVYDEQGRMAQMVNEGLVRAIYSYNGLGQRTQVRSFLSSGPEYYLTYLYGPDGQILGRLRYNNLGKLTLGQYWIWLDGMPLAGLEFKYNTNGAVSSTNLYYLHSDNLNTPRMATNASQALLWTWNSDEFGVGLPQDDVDGDGVKLDMPLRFPGQLLDAHSQMHYNYFRDYDQNRGRYVESDPIGLEGGLNTYGYVGGNPINLLDASGLAPCPPGAVSPGTPCYMSDPSGKTGHPNEGRCATGDCVANIPRRNDLRGPDFVNFQVDMCVVSFWGTFSRDGNSFAGIGFNRTYPSILNRSGSVSFGWLNRGYIQDGDVNNFLNGYSGSGTKAYYYVGGGVASSPGNGTATMIGVGAGGSVGASSNNGGSMGAGNSYNQGETGVKW